MIKNKWKDNKRKLIKREIQWELLKDCRMKRLIPKSMKMKERNYCGMKKLERLRKAMENEILWKVIWEKRRYVEMLRRKQERLKEKLEDRLSIFTRGAVFEDLQEWEDRFRKKLEGEMKKRRVKMEMDLTEEELNKRVKVIGKITVEEEEKRFLALERNFKIENRDWKKEDILLDVEDILYSEKKDEEEGDRIRRKVVPVVERANKNRRDNLTEKERRGMRKLKDRKEEGL